MDKRAYIQEAVIAHGRNPAYFYVPKGKALKPENFETIASMLRELDKFDDVTWDLAQPSLANRFQELELIKPYKDNRNSLREFSAIVRMQIPVWKMLGLAWVNDDNVPEVTGVGRKFYGSKPKQREILAAKQLARYQDGNPSLDRKFQGTAKFPHEVYLRLLSLLKWKITNDEYMLFACRATQDDVTSIAHDIMVWRELNTDDQTHIRGVAYSLRLDGSYIFRTIQQMSSYARAYLALSPYINRGQHGVEIFPNDREGALAYINEYNSAVSIDYQNEGDWLASFGDPLPSQKDVPWTTLADAQDYYEDIGNIDKATEAFSRRSAVGRSETEEYKTVLVKEKVLEDILEHRLDLISDDLKLLGRQYPTSVGPIDLLAEDSNGDYVVIELKKGRASDKVIGQVQRYMGWVDVRLATPQSRNVKGILVGKTFDQKNASAIQATSNISTFTYDISATVDQVHLTVS